MIKGNALGLIGLAARAREVESGADAVEGIIKKRKVKLVIVAEDAADRTKKNFEYLCAKFNILYIIYGKKDDLSRAIGKDNKAVIGIKEQNLAKEIHKVICGGEAIE